MVYRINNQAVFPTSNPQVDAILAMLRRSLDHAPLLLEGWPLTVTAKPSADESKLKELILYIATLCSMDERFGKIKLNKILFKADFNAFRMWGKPITGVEYFALPQGPAPRAMAKLLQIMQQKTHEIDIHEVEYFGHKQERVIPLRSADVNRFTPEEMNLIFRIIQEDWYKSGSSLSTESHDFLGWQVARKEETIPYSVALIGDRDPTLHEIQRGLELEGLAQECLAADAAG